MIKFWINISAVLGIGLLSSFQWLTEEEGYSLTVTVENLQNSNGVVQFTLYNKTGTIPDEEYEYYFKQEIGEIENKTSTYVFVNLPPGSYAINILHDEDENGQIKKGWLLPKEGIGFSNFESIGFSNRPNFKKASFYLDQDLEKKIKVIYM